MKEDRVILVELGLVTENGVDDCSEDLILRFCHEGLTKNACKVGFICGLVE